MVRKMAQIVVVICALFWVGCGPAAEVPAPENTHKHEDIHSQMESLFPEAIEGSEWRRSDGVTIFDDINLFEHINGAAEAFFAYGFQLCGTAEYIPGNGNGKAPASSEDVFIQVDIYNMERPIYAFGMYTSEIYSEAELVEIGAQGYIETPALNFWKGSYYVKIMGASVDESASKANMEIGKHIAAQIPGEAKNPPMLSLLPREGLITGTETFVLDDILGYSFLKNGVMADYQMGDTKKSLLIMESLSSDESKTLFTQFAEYEGKSGSGMADLPSLGEKGFIVDDKYYKRLMVVRQGRYVLVTLDVTDESAARKLIETAIDNIIIVDEREGHVDRRNRG